jgi:hypothetical protein
MCPKPKDAVRGCVSSVDGLDVLPAGGEFTKIVRRKGAHGRPDEVAGHGWPNSGGDIFEPRRGSKSGFPYVVNGRDLKNKIADGAGADIRQEFVWGRFARIVVARRDLDAVIALNATDMNVNAAGNEPTTAKSIPNALGEK